MIVCAHGNVDKFCAEHDMVIVERHEGDIACYSGSCAVIVTDSEMQYPTYCVLKTEMLGRGVELVSTKYVDDAVMSEYVYHNARKRSRPGRPRFGLLSDGSLSENGRRVSRIVLEMRDMGYTVKAIMEHPDVCYPDGRRLSITTVQSIIKNRVMYEKD